MEIKLPDPLDMRTPLDFTIVIPIHMAYNKKREVGIVEGDAPYGISTEERINKKILKDYQPIEPKPNPLKIALEYQKVYKTLPKPSMTETAKIFGVSRVRVHQMLNLLKLDKRIISKLLEIKHISLSERKLRKLIYLPIDAQEAHLKEFLIGVDFVVK